MTNIRTIRTAIIGTGFMSWVHADALRRNGVEVYGILGSSFDKSEAAALQLGIPHAFRDLDSLLTDPSIDCVHVCTPNRSHFEIVTKAIAAGKHVLCEKPLAMSSEESAALNELAAKHCELCTAVNYNIRFYPLCA